MKIVKKSYDQPLAKEILLHLKPLWQVNPTTKLRQSYDKSYEIL